MKKIMGCVSVMVGLWLLVGGCGPVEQVCAPGATQLCHCLSLKLGVQRCRDDGQLWGGCVCQQDPLADGDVRDGGVEPAAKEPTRDTSERTKEARPGRDAKADEPSVEPVLDRAEPLSGEPVTPEPVSDAGDGGEPPEEPVRPEQDCQDGQQRPCYSGASGCSLSGSPQCLGSCRAGTQRCAEGRWGACTGEQLPTQERCNGLDDDCDGQIDQDIPPQRCGKGACGQTAPGCQGGVVPPCVPLPAAAPERCANAIDDDCDGQTDEGCAYCLPIKHTKTIEKPHRDGVLGLTFRADDRFLASVASGREIRLWDTSQGRLVPLSVPLPTSQGIPSVAFAPGSGLFALSQGGQDIELRDLTTGARKDTLAFKQTIRDFAFHPGGTWLAVNLGGDVGIWSMAQQAFVARWASQPRRLQFSPDGKWLVTWGSQSISVLPVGVWKQARSLQTSHRIWSLDISTDGAWIAAGLENGQVKLWERATGKLLQTFAGTNDELRCVSIRPDKRWIAAAGAGPVRIWDTQSGALVEQIQSRYSSYCARFSHNGKSLAVGSAIGNIGLWDVSTRRLRDVTGFEDRLQGMALGPKGTLLIMSNTVRSLVWDISTGRLRQELPLPGHSWSAFFHGNGAIHPNGKLVATGHEDAQIRLWDLATGRVSRTIPSGYQPGSGKACQGNVDCPLGEECFQQVCARPDPRKGHLKRLRDIRFSPSGAWMASSDAGGQIHVWDPLTGQHKSRTPAMGKGTHVAFLDEQRLILHDASQRVTAWGWLLGTLHWQLPQAGPSGVVSLSPSRKRMAVSDGASLGLYVSASGAPTASLSGYQRSFGEVSFHSTETMLAAGWDQEVIFWDLQSRQIVYQHKLGRAVSGVWLLPDGRSMIVATDDKSTTKPHTRLHFTTCP